jgi:hypothetical protein
MKNRVVRLGVPVLTLLVAAITPAAHADGPITYTVEPFDGDGVLGMVHTVTQAQLGGSLCPCVKIPYPADAMHNQQGADAIANTPLKAGDTVMGFSLGSQVISLYLSQHTPPPGVRFVLLGDTFERNDRFLASGQGVPLDIANEVLFVANQYDGWSDMPTDVSAPGYQLALQNANAGKQSVHNYVNARLDDPANVRTTRGNITAILIPTQKLPLNRRMREQGRNAEADQLDGEQRPLIDGAYGRPGPNLQQLLASIAQQVGIPKPLPPETPEPLAGSGR